MPIVTQATDLPEPEEGEIKNCLRDIENVSGYLKVNQLSEFNSTGAAFEKLVTCISNLNDRLAALEKEGK